ncbi:MAG: flagellar hook-basal body complex protein FliE [Thermoplasmatales archaeon]|nr:MAG: flagellar hook-basal body complex protein FliE [Thermoplasmatales archaeon]
MKIVAFTGMPCSGKTEAVEIAKALGIPVIRMGDMVWEEVKNQGLELNDENVGAIANMMRKEHGRNIWARRTVDKIKSLNLANIIVVDGIRNIEEVNLFKKELSNDFVIIAITASHELRKKRALSRGRKDDSNDIKDIEERDKREVGWGIGDVIALADIVISNERDIDEFRIRVKQVLQKL